MADLILQGHTEAPKRHEAPHHPKPAHHTPAKPASRHEPVRRAQRDPHERRQQRKESHPDRGRKPAHKSAPEHERSLPIGSGVRVGIPSLGALPNTIRRH